MSPDQIDRCALWKYMAAYKGWKRANTPENKTVTSLSDEDVSGFREQGVEGL